MSRRLIPVELSREAKATPGGSTRVMVAGNSSCAPRSSRPGPVAQALILLHRQGVKTVARKVICRLVGPLLGRFQVWGLRRHPWVADSRPVFLMVSHVGGGGTEKHVRDLMHRLRQEQVRPLLLRPDRRGHLLWEEHNAQGRLCWCRSTDFRATAIDQLLDLIDPRHAHIHHTMGHPDILLRRLIARGLTPDWTIHDYHAICPRIHLNQADGSYCGEPDAAGCTRCLAASGDYQGRPFQGEIRTWRSKFAEQLSGARRVFVPSDDVSRRLSRYMPGLPIAVRPHFEDLPARSDLARRRAAGEVIRVAVIGAIVTVKGSGRLLACAQEARQNRLPLEFHVIGPTDRDREFARLGNVRVTGPYREAEVFDHLERARCHVAFLPSIWPETYMYTLSVAMAAGLYTVCYDVGAQADRARAWGHGVVLPLASPAETVNRTLLTAANRLVNAVTSPPDRPTAVYPHLLTDYYDFTPEQWTRLGLPPVRQTHHPAPHFPSRTRHARLH